MNEVGDDTSSILYRVKVNDQPTTALFDTGVSMGVISLRFFQQPQAQGKNTKMQ